MKNIVSDLGGVLFARRRSECPQDFIDFFAFIRQEEIPHFWVEYDRGTATLDEVTEELCRRTGCDRAKCEGYLRTAIDLQRPVEATERLIGELKQAGYKLFVLSNMSCEFIDYLRRFPVYRLFDGEVVSCEEHAVKPEPQIYRILLERYGLRPDETLFIDDRRANIEAAEAMGIHGHLFDSHDPEGACDAIRKRLAL